MNFVAIDIQLRTPIVPIASFFALPTLLLISGGEPTPHWDRSGRNADCHLSHE
jgi:hypothetical protein